MKKWIAMGLIICMVTAMLTGCKRNSEREIIDSIEETIGDSTVSGDVSPLTGLPLNEDQVLPVPVAVMIDNFSTARPQASLNQADIVYEMMAEGLITRYMAIYYSQKPDVVGPIRSARPYFIEKAMEYGSVYVHVGGSPQALQDLKQLNIPQIEGLTSSLMYRDKSNGKTAPHNMYANGEKMWAEMSNKGYFDAPVDRDRLKQFSFADESPYESGIDVATEKISAAQLISDGKNGLATRVVLQYKGKTPQKPNYLVTYMYQSDQKKYARLLNEKACVDEKDGLPVEPSNVIIQFAGSKVMDTVGRLEMSFVGDGQGLLLTNGQVIPIRWSKTSREGRTEFVDTSGQELVLNPGQTWIQVISSPEQIGW